MKKPYALKNVIGNFIVGRPTRKTNTLGRQLTKKPHFYKTEKDVINAYCKLGSLQRVVILPVRIEGENNG